MTISGFEIEELKDVKGWYKMTFKSQKSNVGASNFEMLVSAETLRFIRNQMNRAMGIKRDYSQDPENLRKFMEDTE